MIFYIASYPRSGNTWVRGFIGSQFGRLPAAVHGPRRNGRRLEEWVHWASVAYNLRVTYPITGELASILDIDLPQHWFAAYWFEGEKDNPHFTLVPGFETDLSDGVRQKLCTSQEKLFFKTHSRPFPHYFPGEFVIQVVRHPGASLWSYYNFMCDIRGSDLTLDDIILGKVNFGRWDDYHLAWTKSSKILGSRYLQVKYEDLFGQELAFCQRLSEFLGLPIINDVFKSFEESKKMRPLLAREGKPTGWHSHYSPVQLDALFQEHGNLMKILGYDQ
ncbi:MAG: sulfotransferase domain-containing protein [Anaerolineae bacterium]|nr:sulfotransferase domain-containing protein [Anaerolineae bacterium]